MQIRLRGDAGDGVTMSTGTGPTGVVLANDERTTTGPGGALGRWLRPGPPRTHAAVLLMLSAVSSVLAWVVLAGVVGVDRAGLAQLLLFWVLPVAGAISFVAVAAFVVTGSPASRVLGGLTAISGLIVPFVPLLSVGTTLADLASVGLALATFAAVILFHLGAVVALALPAPSATKRR